jgi:predicted O-methyltransferase YrrM
MSVATAIRRAHERRDSVDLSWLDPLPPDDGWTLAPDTIAFVTALVAELEPRHILEFGSGLSTRVLTRAAQSLPTPARVTSLESDPEEFARARALPEADLVDLRLAPVVARDWGGKVVPFYAVEGELAAPVDLALIDGPPEALGGREGILYQLLGWSRPGTVAVLDDAARGAERAAIRAWRDNLGQSLDVELVPGYAKGLAVVELRDDLARIDAWTHRAALVQRELEELVRPAGTFLLADGWSFADELLPAGRRAVRFPDDDGDWDGRPGDVERAYAELGRFRAAGVERLAVTWQCSWWADVHGELLDRLGTPLLANDRLTVYDLSHA